MQVDKSSDLEANNMKILTLAVATLSQAVSVFTEVPIKFDHLPF